MLPSPPTLIKTHLFPASLETQLFIESDLIKHSGPRPPHTNVVNRIWNVMWETVNITLYTTSIILQVFPIGYSLPRHHLRALSTEVVTASCDWLPSPPPLPVVHLAPAPPSYWPGRTQYHWWLGCLAHQATVVNNLQSILKIYKIQQLQGKSPSHNL